MDEPINVEATPIDTELAALSEADKWLANAAERVAERRELYKPPKKIRSEKERANVTKARTQVRKDAAEIDNERKAMLRRAEDALKSFKENVKDVLSPLTDLDAEYKRLLDEYEETWRAKRQVELAQEYRDMAPDLADLVPFERLMERYGNESGKVWLNRSTNIELAKDLMADAVHDIAEGEKDIEDAVAEPDERKEAKVYFFQTLDSRATLTHIRQVREKREALARLEAERAAREQQWSNPRPEPEAVATQPEPAAPKPKVSQSAEQPHKWYIELTGTRSDVELVARILREGGFRFDSIRSGNTWQLLRVRE